MGGESSWGISPTSPPPLYAPRGEHWRHFENSVNALSLGFVATAILVSMFLVMAILERYLTPTSPDLKPSGGGYFGDIESQMGFSGKLGHPSPKVPTSGREVSVVMPGDDTPTFIAHLAPPVPCPPERRITGRPHQHISVPSFVSSSSSS